LLLVPTNKGYQPLLAPTQINVSRSWKLLIINFVVKGSQLETYVRKASRELMDQVNPIGCLTLPNCRGRKFTRKFCTPKDPRKYPKANITFATKKYMLLMSLVLILFMR
jgi:hypothetical protein